MKILSVCSITMLCIALTHNATARNSLPPEGPYRSLQDSKSQDINTGQLNQDQSQTNEETHKNGQPGMHSQQILQAGDWKPEWVVRQQAEIQAMIEQQQRQMEEWQKQVREHQQQQQRNEIPQWARQQQAQMELLARQMKEAYPQPQQHFQQQNLDEQGQSKHEQSIRPGQQTTQTQDQAVSESSDESNVNDMHAYFPSARGPVYGPNMAPPQFYQPPGYPNQAYPSRQRPGSHFPMNKYPGTGMPGPNGPGTNIPGSSYPGVHVPGAQFPGPQYRNNYPPVWR